jgi:hypothetical protein
MLIALNIRDKILFTESLPRLGNPLIMTVEANTEVYKGYSIEVAIDAPPLDTWQCRITDPQGRLFAKSPGCNSRESAFIVAEQIIDADILTEGRDIEYQNPREYPDFTG